MKRIAGIGLIFILIGIITVLSFFLFLKERDSVFSYRLVYVVLFELLAGAGTCLYMTRPNTGFTLRKIFLISFLLCLVVQGIVLFLLPAAELLKAFSKSHHSLITLAAGVEMIWMVCYFFISRNIKMKKAVPILVLMLGSLTFLLLFLSFKKKESGFNEYFLLSLLFDSGLAVWFAVIWDIRQAKSAKTVVLVLNPIIVLAEFLMLFLLPGLIGTPKLGTIHLTWIFSVFGGHAFIMTAGLFLLKKISFKRFWYLFTGIPVVMTAVFFLLSGKSIDGDFLHDFAFSLGIVIEFSLGTVILLSRKRLKEPVRYISLAVIIILTLVQALALARSPIWFGFRPRSMVHVLLTGGGLAAGIIFQAIAALVFPKIKTFRKKKSRIKTKKRDVKGRETVKPPFPAYKGSGSYIFISYSHRNMDDVFRTIHTLNKQGFRIWYDEGIEPGKEWPEVIGKAISGCSQLLVFMSPSAAQSRNVRNEINFAFKKKKEMVIVLLAKTGLSSGLDLQIGTFQFIKKYELTENEFLTKLREVLKK